MELEVKVIPNSKRFSIQVDGDRLRVHLKSQPEKGRANMELVEEISKILGKEVRIIKGLKSTRKVIHVDGKKEEILQALRREGS